MFRPYGFRRSPGGNREIVSCSVVARAEGQRQGAEGVHSWGMLYIPHSLVIHDDDDDDDACVVVCFVACLCFHAHVKAHLDMYMYCHVFISCYIGFIV